MKQNLIITMLGLIVVLLSYIAMSLPSTSSNLKQEKQHQAYEYKIVQFDTNPKDQKYDTWFNEFNYEYVGVLSPYYNKQGEYWGYDVLLRRPK